MPSLFRRFAIRVAVAAGVSFAAAHSIPAQQSSPWPTFAQQFRDYVTQDGIIGASALIMRNGQPTARVNLGLQNRATNTAVTDRTIYHWGSITKSLTAIAIMQLRDRGRLSLDDKVTRYLPELRKIHDPFGRIDSITIRMLMSHTAGFRNGTWPYGADFDPGITTPNGGWNAPLDDLVTYVAFLTNLIPAGGSQARYDVVLSRASLKEMWTPVAPMAAGEGGVQPHA